jgi:hypothetical protein
MQGEVGLTARGPDSAGGGGQGIVAGRELAGPLYVYCTHSGIVIYLCTIIYALVCVCVVFLCCTKFIARVGTCAGCRGGCSGKKAMEADATADHATQTPSAGGAVNWTLICLTEQLSNYI